MRDLDVLENVVRGILDSGGPLAERLDRLGTPPVELFALACGTAHAILHQDDAPASAAPLGALAFVTGFLAGVGRVPSAGRRRSLADAVDLVSRHGRHAIIAQRCDLGDTAAKETLSGALLGAVAAPLGDAARTRVERACRRLYESGLATGLLAAEAV